jgi:DNA polymerase-3 subunit delta
LVEAAGGECRQYSAPKPWEMPKWVLERATEYGLHLDLEAAKALVAAVGTRQQRLVREVEKLALTAHPRTSLQAEEVERLSAGTSSRQAYDLADERPARLVFPVVRRLREVHRAASLLDAGVPEQKVSGAMKMPPWAAKRTLARARQADRDRLERAICLFADLEVELRGAADLDEDTAFSRVLVTATA